MLRLAPISKKKSLHMDIALATKFFGALFAIMNPFINLPIFLALTANKTFAQQRSMAVMIAIYAAVMCVIIAFAGTKIIGFFGLSIDTFRVAGGLVLLGIAFSMLNGKEITSHERGDHEKHPDDTQDSIAFYPMTFPMIVGPGTIAVIIIYTAQAHSAAQYTALGVVIAVILLMLFAVLFFAATIGKLLSAQMRVVMTRLMGMILAAIAVEMILAGVKVILPGLA